MGFVIAMLVGDDVALANVIELGFAVRGPVEALGVGQPILPGGPQKMNDCAAACLYAGTTNATANNATKNQLKESRI